MKITRSLLLTLVLALVAAVAAGCGSSSSGSGGASDPAAAVPATTPVYLEANVHPDGKLGDDVTAVLKKVLRTDDPAAKLKGLFDQSAKDHGVTYDKDVAPWLGDRVGVAVTSFAANKPAFVVVAGSKDDAKARAALTKGRKVVKRSYKGVDYSYDAKDQSASAAFGGRAFAGTESGIRAAIDATKGQSLADANSLRAAREKVASERAGFAYFDVQGLLRLFQQSAGGRDPQIGAALQAVGGQLPKTVAAALEADPDLIRVDAVSIGTPKGTSSGKSGADALGQLPGDAFAAAGFADLGATFERSLKQIGGSGLGGVGVEALMRQFRQQTGLDLRQDLLSWMGDAGLYVSGNSVSDLHGALVVKSTDPARTRKAIGALQRLAHTMAKNAKVSTLSGAGIDRGFSIKSAGSPPIDVVLAGDKFVVAVGGTKALQDAIKPATPLSSAPAFTAAAGKLGDGIKPAFFLDAAKLTALVGAKAGSDPDFAKAKPYLDTFAALVGGAKDEGDGVTRARFAITLK